MAFNNGIFIPNLKQRIPIFREFIAWFIAICLFLKNTPKKFLYLTFINFVNNIAIFIPKLNRFNPLNRKAFFSPFISSFIPLFELATFFLQVHLIYSLIYPTTPISIYPLLYNQNHSLILMIRPQILCNSL